jgi:hypothetical protein
VECDPSPTCSQQCGQSTLFQGTLSRFAARLSGGGAPPDASATTAAAAAAAAAAAINRVAIAASSPRASSTWWRLNNTNCNLHDMTDVTCKAGEAIAACQATCEAHADCGGFLYYTQSGRFALKNATCIDDVGPLPPSDAGDDLFVLRSFPQPAPLPAQGGVVSTVQVCVADASEDLGPSTDESYSVSVDGDGTTKVAAR